MKKRKKKWKKPRDSKWGKSIAVVPQQVGEGTRGFRQPKQRFITLSEEERHAAYLAKHSPTTAAP